MSVQKLLVVGGNGFLGSAVCRLAVAKGWDVSSMSSSGTPYSTPAGHTPPWVQRVTWHKASAFEPEQYAAHLREQTAVVHSLGILLEDAGYKQAVREGDVLGVMKAVGGSLFGSPPPLRSKDEMRRGYEGMNRDSVLDTYLNSVSAQATPPGAVPTNPPRRSFVYISAADAFRPLIPARYIQTKREAERGIVRLCAEQPESGVRGIFMRPGLMYHPHTRPVSTLPSFLLSLSASLHDRLNPSAPPSTAPAPAQTGLGGAGNGADASANDGMLGQAARAAQTHPLHVDHVAAAVLRSIEEQREGVVDVRTMRTWAGFGPEAGAGAGAGAERGVGADGGRVGL